MYKILIVEDDSIIASAIAKHLAAWGLQAVLIKDFQHVTETFAKEDPQLVLMDITLPFFNGYHWCEEIRRISKVPIIFLSSASDNMNIVMAMNMGGDDFIAKPFDINVLTAKIQAVLRRTYDFGAPANLIEHAGAILNLSDATFSFSDQKLSLSKNELKILQALMENKGHVVRREDLMTRLWETDSYVDENTLTVNINRLRRKLEELGLSDFIVTKKGLGYMVKA
ncbi:MAG: response regulator transcription factor [Oscillospiraceae bacterium]|nr:response regulator transcription factor [Oscillospiraceae bacterium]MDD3260724.1 response regulator transcription factor [Oscillospiraceae bacterium]